VIPPRAIVFDLDDTLADTHGSLLEAAERTGIAKLVEAGLGTDAETAWGALREIRAGDPGARFLRALIDRFGAPDPDRCHDAARRAFFGMPPDPIRSVEGAREVLRALRDRGIPLYLVTFGVPEAQARKVEVLGIGPFFEAVRIAPLTDGPDKTRLLAEILRETGAPPGAVWVVGDRPPGEIRAGNRLGMQTIRVRRGEFERLEPAGPHEEADVTIRSVRELLSLLP